jgi:hypothetical protein
MPSTTLIAMSAKRTGPQGTKGPSNEGLPVMPDEDWSALSAEAKSLLRELADLQKDKSARSTEVFAKIEQIIQALEAVQRPR